jgi:hypothetical protein
MTCEPSAGQLDSRVGSGAARCISRTFRRLSKELAPALERAIAVVKSGQPALVDVVSEPR